MFPIPTAAPIEARRNPVDDHLLLERGLLLPRGLDLERDSDLWSGLSGMHIIGQGGINDSLKEQKQILFLFFLC